MMIELHLLVLLCSSGRYVGATCDDRLRRISNQATVSMVRSRRPP